MMQKLVLFKVFLLTLIWKSKRHVRLMDILNVNHLILQQSYEREKPTDLRRPCHRKQARLWGRPWPQNLSLSQSTARKTAPVGQTLQRKHSTAGGQKRIATHILHLKMSPHTPKRGTNMCYIHKYDAYIALSTFLPSMYECDTLEWLLCFKIFL